MSGLGNNSSWEATGHNAQQVLAMLADLQPTLLHRYVSGAQFPSKLVPVCPACAPMTVTQFLQASESTSNAVIVARLSLWSYDNGTLFTQAHSILSIPVNPPIRMLSLDDFSGWIQVHNSTQFTSIINTLKAQGWTYIEAGGCGSHSAIPDGATNYASVCFRSPNWAVSAGSVAAWNSYESIRFLLGTQDFPRDIPVLQSLTSSQLASIYRNVAANQSVLGYHMIYFILQGSWDTTQETATAPGFSGTLYAYMKMLMGIYNPLPTPTTSTTTSPTSSTNTTTSSSTSISTTSITSGSISSTVTGSTSTTTLSTTSTSFSTTSTSILSTNTSSSSSSLSTTGTSSASSASSTTYSEPSTYSLTIQGGCSPTGGGDYPAGTVATATTLGVCNRAFGTGTRIISWSLDGGPAHDISTFSSLEVPVTMNSSHVLTFNRDTQYQLTLDYGAKLALASMTPTSIPFDNYWYDSGSLVTYSGFGAIQSFQVANWSWDNGSIKDVVGEPQFTTSSMLMNESHTLHVSVISSQTESCIEEGTCSGLLGSVYLESSPPTQIQFLVDGQTYPSPVSLSWPVGTNHTITALESQDSGAIKSQFAGWGGSINSSSNTISVVVEPTIRLVANYNTEILVQFEFTDAVGNPLTLDSVSLSRGSNPIPLGSNLTAWLTYGARYSVTDPIWQGVNVPLTGNDTGFRVSSASTVILPLYVFPETVKATDIFGMPIAGVQVVLNTGGGLQETAMTDNAGYATFEVPSGTYSATASVLGLVYSATQAAVGSHPMSIIVLIDLPVLILASSASASLGALFWRLRSRRHEAKILREIFH
jgi:hypothetical protein